MEKITFSSMNSLDPLALGAFQAQNRIDVQTQNVGWGEAWSELLKIGLYNQGPDVSEIGSTWIGSLIEMNAITPLSSKIISLQELEKSFYPGAYQGVIGADGKKIWGVPWLTDTRVLYYRRSWLKKAGIDEKTAFEDTHALKDTLKKLQNAGFKTPFTMPTADTNVVYNAASWIWQAGGNFRTPDGRALILTQPEAQAGLLEHFSLHPFLAPQARGLKMVEADNLFREGEAAVALSGPWLFKWLEQDGKYFSDLGVAKIPGVPFIGGTHVVLWAHNFLGDSVIQKFIRFLTSIETQSHFVQKTTLLPARIEVLNTEPFANNPFYKIFAESLNTGRVFKISYRWAAVEQRLMGLFNSIWADLAKNPDVDLKKELYQRTDTVISRLNKTILTNL